MITRRHTRRIIALLLPLMMLRALLPTGYMPVAENGELRMVMCSSGMQLPGSEHHPGGDHTEQSKHQSDSTCPFASALGSAPPVQYIPTTVVSPIESRFTSLTANTLPPATGPPRTTAARAPPALS